MTPTLTPAQLRAAYAREWQELCEVKAAARRPVPDTIITDDQPPGLTQSVGPPCYVRPADPYTRVRWCGE